jgi:hypothetical protein
MEIYPNYRHPQSIEGGITTRNCKADINFFLQVLLPPATASMYEQLLKLEAFELRKKAALSWERILEIRHLKDRMIRKCQKLAKTSSSKMPVDPFTFQSIIAPSDFRVNAMEKWFQQQQKRTNAFLQHPPARPTGLEDSRLASRSTEHVHSTRSSVGLPHSTQHSRSNASKRVHAKTQFSPQSSRLSFLPQKSASLATLPSPVQASSPPPLPHLLRLRDPETGYDLSADPQRFISHPFDPDAKDLLPHKESSTSPKQDINTESSEIRRRRSCIKQSSIGDLVKRVSWADDSGIAEQVSKYSSAVRDVYATG